MKQNDAKQSNQYPLLFIYSPDIILMKCIVLVQAKCNKNDVLKPLKEKRLHIKSAFLDFQIKALVLARSPLTQRFSNFILAATPTNYLDIFSAHSYSKKAFLTVNISYSYFRITTRIPKK